MEPISRSLVGCSPWITTACGNTPFPQVYTTAPLIYLSQCSAFRTIDDRYIVVLMQIRVQIQDSISLIKSVQNTLYSRTLVLSKNAYSPDTQAWKLYHNRFKSARDLECNTLYTSQPALTMHPKDDVVTWILNIPIHILIYLSFTWTSNSPLREIFIRGHACIKI